LDFIQVGFIRFRMVFFSHRGGFIKVFDCKVMQLIEPFQFAPDRSAPLVVLRNQEAFYRLRALPNLRMVVWATGIWPGTPPRGSVKWMFAMVKPCEHIKKRYL